MDYAGIDARNLRYAVNRALTAAEEGERLDVSVAVDAPLQSGLSVIKFSATYLELVDRWYPVKGFNVWLSVLGALAFIPTSSYLLVNLIIFGEPFKEDERWILWCFWIFIVPVSLFILAGIVWLFRSECFRWTHYPIRLDRIRRKVHFFRQNGTVATGSWDRLFFFIGESTTPPIGRTNDIRAHFLSEDGKTVLETFSLGYVYMGSRRDLLGLWEFIRQYMEGNDEVVARLCAEVTICIPVHDRREGFVFGVVRTFAGLIHWPWLHVVACLPFSFIAMARWVAMSTCRIPVWPKEIENDCAVTGKSQWQRDWRDNPGLGFLDETWPLICTAVGAGGGLYLIYLIEHSLG
ncbi:DUF6708 domain-containing protein [Stenotrophomonas indicatrix]|uniref:DUF6708 domain-containing protein n=1 Tax=Stenotrophomonas indicatrix TaxID=2045451 RepID=UPI001AA17394|nr:DUF6708 domain-containing protein [Stenotrophomonas indicatrix]MBO1748568.1 hypothetical protein [Stenotrophomonas indicatrix]